MTVTRNALKISRQISGLLREAVNTLQEMTDQTLVPADPQSGLPSLASLIACSMLAVETR